jgi:predicted alpha/beta superfamily hydrolase
LRFWDLFQKKKAENIKDENLTDDETSKELIFAKKFTDAGGRFIYIDDGDSVINTFNKISEENNWKKKMSSVLVLAYQTTLVLKKQMI